MSLQMFLPVLLIMAPIGAWYTYCFIELALKSDRTEEEVKKAARCGFSAMLNILATIVLAIWAHSVVVRGVPIL